MGMSVKGLQQHRLIAKAIGLLLSEINYLTADEVADCERLRRRADLAIERHKHKKLLRAARRGSERA